MEEGRSPSLTLFIYGLRLCPFKTPSLFIVYATSQKKGKKFFKEAGCPLTSQIQGNLERANAYLTPQTWGSLRGRQPPLSTPPLPLGKGKGTQGMGLLGMRRRAGHFSTSPATPPV